MFSCHYHLSVIWCWTIRWSFQKRKMTWKQFIKKWWL
jgi:hypothetical protein